VRQREREREYTIIEYAIIVIIDKEHNKNYRLHKQKRKQTDKTGYNTT